MHACSDVAHVCGVADSLFSLLCVLFAFAVAQLFFGVWPAEGATQAASFQVTPGYLNQAHSTSPLVMANDLTPVALSPGSVEFQFFPATSQLGTPADEMIYTVYWTRTDDTNAMLYTECGVAALQQRTGQGKFIKLPADINTNPGAVITATMDNLDDYSYKFNVFVADPASTTGPTAYKVNQAKPHGGSDGGGGGGSTSNKILLGIGIPLAIIVVSLLGYLWYRNRQLSKELSIEMHDVPAAALRKAARGAPDVSKVERAKNFHKLLSEEDTDSAGDQYIAPGGSINPPSAVDEL